ncbi:MAG: trypsin-like peptidase domain-containing protein [Bacteroidetes bacterium]|nr:trypsin-like peptidase domain-containing protein [Bacteroidota bacterium]
MKSLFLLLPGILFILSCQPDSTKKWTPSEGPWPQIGMMNEVWYQNGERYIHSSFEYAGSGFLIDYQGKTLAATAKHVLWIAKTKAMQTVNPNPFLERWIMHPKGNLADSVVLDQLINTDTSEYLQGSGATITERDWLVFTTKSVSPNIKPLTPSFRQLRAGETVYFQGCPYKDSTCVSGSGKVFLSRGSRFEFTKDDSSFQANGISGSPILDSSGYLVGIFSGTSVNRENGDPGFLGVSTHYLEKVLNGETDINQRMTPIYDYLSQEIVQNGIEGAVDNYHELVGNPDNYFDYHVTPEGFNQLVRELLDAGDIQGALAILELSMEDHSQYSRTFALLGKTYLALGELEEAEKALEDALRLWPENKEALELMEELKK